MPDDESRLFTVDRDCPDDFTPSFTDSDNPTCAQNYDASRKSECQGNKGCESDYCLTADMPFAKGQIAATDNLESNRATAGDNIKA